MVKVSVIIPVYNTEEFLAECLDSVCKQSLKDIEIICINDGSTDNSQAILEQYAKQDNRINIINQENQGLSFVCNLGIKTACGEYIAFVDSDDWISLDFLEALYNTAIKKNADIVAGGFKRVYNKYKQDSWLKYKKVKTAKTLSGKFNLFNMPTHNYKCNKIYKRTLLTDNELYFPIGRYYEDMFWSNHVVKACKLAAVAPNVWYFYRLNENSISQTVSEDPKKLEDRTWALAYQADFIKKNHIKIAPKYQKKIKVSFLGIPLIKILENEKVKKFYFCGIKFMQIHFSKG